MTISLICFALLLGGPPTDRSAAQPAQDRTRMDTSVPKLLMEPLFSAPVWVSAEEALTSAGELDSALFHPAAARQIKEWLSSRKIDGCVSVREIYSQQIGASSRKSINDVLATADVVLLGRVVARSFGFYGGDPGQLLKVAPEQEFRGVGLNEPAYYVFYPVGRFKVDGITICKTDSRYPEPPAIQERVFLFTGQPLGERNNILQLSQPGDMVIVRKGGRLEIPASFTDTTGLTTATELKRTLQQGYHAKEK